jgi:hypothetical protein
VPKIDIKVLAATAEIIASIAVVVSLIFVVLSLNQNTAALRSVNDNLIYELQDERLADASNNAELADIVVRARAGEELSEAEQLQFFFWVSRDLATWELAFNRHREGMMPPAQWIAWDESFKANITSRLREETWNSSKIGYGGDFQKHVDAAYAQQ